MHERNFRKNVPLEADGKEKMEKKVLIGASHEPKKKQRTRGFGREARGEKKTPAVRRGNVRGSGSLDADWKRTSKLTRKSQLSESRARQIEQ